MKSFGNVFRPLSWLTAVSLAAVVAGCGGGGSDAPPPPAAPAVSAKPIGDIAGVWTITETDIQSTEPSCTPAGGNALATYPVTVTQASGSNTISVAGDRSNGTTPTTFAGTLKGNQASWTGKFAEQGGSTTINSLDSTVATDCNGMSGTSNWTFVQDAPSTFTCSGKTQFTGTRNTASGCTAAQSGS